jgi:hypothetical protein
MGEPMPLAIPGYHVVRNSSALPVAINRIAFETPFFVVRPRPVIAEPAGTTIMAEDPGPSERARINTSPLAREAMWRDAARPTGDKDNYSSVDRRAY